MENRKNINGSHLIIMSLILAIAFCCATIVTQLFNWGWIATVFITIKLAITISAGIWYPPLKEAFLDFFPQLAQDVRLVFLRMEMNDGKTWEYYVLCRDEDFESEKVKIPVRGFILYESEPSTKVMTPYNNFKMFPDLTKMSIYKENSVLMDPAFLMEIKKYNNILKANQIKGLHNVTKQDYDTVETK